MLSSNLSKQCGPIICTVISAVIMWSNLSWYYVGHCDNSGRKWISLPEASFGLRVLSLPASVCVCVCVCGNHEIVCVITHHPFKLGSPNLDQRCKTTWLRSLLFYGTFDLDLQGQIELQSQNLPPFWACPCHNSPPIEVTISKFGTKMHLSTVQICTNFGLDWNWSSIQFLISNPDQIEPFMYIIGIL